jgi:HK97 family phage portal protein
MIPARFIVHHRLMTGAHPLIGISPLSAAAASAGLGREIQAQSAQFFGNQSRPSGVLKTPRTLNPETAKRLKERWQDLYSGEGLGSVAILEEGLQWEALTITAADAQLVAQLEYAVKDVARVFHVPLHMLGELGGVTYKNAETLSAIYYKGPLSTHLQALEDRFNNAFDMIPFGRRIEFDIHGLLRAEFDVRMVAYKEAIQGGVMTPNEARSLENLGPKDGGDSLYMQQQNMPLESRTATAQQQAALAYLPSAEAIRASAEDLRLAIRARA